MSVCTGSALLAKAGLLDGLAATSNKMFFDLARSQGDLVEWQESARWVDTGQYVTSSGVSAGTDMALAVIERLFGAELATQVVTTPSTNGIDKPMKPLCSAAQSGGSRGVVGR